MTINEVADDVVAAAVVAAPVVAAPLGMDAKTVGVDGRATLAAELLHVSAVAVAAAVE